MASGQRKLVELAVLGGIAATFATAGAFATVALAALVALWLARYARRRERWLVGAFLAAAVAFTGYDAFDRGRSLDPERKLAAIADQFDELWGELDREARAAAEALTGWSDEGATLDPFDLLVRQAQGNERERLTLLLVDPGGAVRAWAGSGLLHDLGELELPASGRSFRLGFQSATLFSVARNPRRGPHRPGRGGPERVHRRPARSRSTPRPGALVGLRTGRRGAPPG